MKTCSKCKAEKDESEFYKDYRKKIGVASQCKKCTSLYENKYYRKIRDKRRYEKDKLKVLAREKARAFYIGREYLCCVFTCGAVAEELHHVDYSDALAVVPLCRKHHKGIHAHGPR